LPPCPPSVTHWVVGLSGVCGFAIALAILLAVRPFSNTVHSMFFLLIGLAVSIFAVDLLWGKVHKRTTTGLDFARWRPSPVRLAHCPEGKDEPGPAHGRQAQGDRRW
jgi:hypothetical protein